MNRNRGGGAPRQMASALGSRWLNIGLRTAHIATMGLLVGGHVFAADPKTDLRLSLWLCVATGIALAASEAGGRTLWFHQGRGLMTFGKLALLGAVPWFWEYRVAILMVVLVIASVGSHMSAGYRYYSVLYRQVIPCRGGPGSAQWDRDQAAVCNDED